MFIVDNIDTSPEFMQYVHKFKEMHEVESLMHLHFEVASHEGLASHEKYRLCGYISRAIGNSPDLVKWHQTHAHEYGNVALWGDVLTLAVAMGEITAVSVALEQGASVFAQPDLDLVHVCGGRPPRAFFARDSGESMHDLMDLLFLASWYWIVPPSLPMLTLLLEKGLDPDRPVGLFDYEWETRFTMVHQPLTARSLVKCSDYVNKGEILELFASYKSDPYPHADVPLGKF